MTIDKEDLLNSIVESLDRIHHIKLDDIPNIDLYMDQVTTFMEKHLKNTTREHVLLLIFIYYYKGILTINDIQTLLNPLTERFFHKDGFDLGDVYSEVFGLEEKHVDMLKDDVVRKFQESKDTFEDAPEDEKAFLQLFSFICMLSFDVYIKKLIIEKVVDCFSMAADEARREGKRNKGDKQE